MAHPPEALPADLADVLRAMLATISPELFGTVPPAVALSVSGDSLTFFDVSGDRAGTPGQPHVGDPGGSSAPVVRHPSAADRVTRRLAGSGHATVSLSGMVARVRRARDLTLAVLTTDAERVVHGARSTVHEGGYAVSQQLTMVAVRGVETLHAGDAATVKIMLRLEAVIELSRARRENEATPSGAVPISEGMS
jgi:hypothetical protein